MKYTIKNFIRIFNMNTKHGQLVTKGYLPIITWGCSSIGEGAVGYRRSSYKHYKMGSNPIFTTNI